MAETKDKIKRQLIINYVPGEECRVAVVNNGRLDEFFSEKRDSVSHVGNIYVGRVTNVEPSIQAAFIDFGLPQGGFLHVSDVHPYYFPSDDSEEGATERVGKKTPRRDRPPIQDCFKRGQEIVVQVLKEGVGSKGPTVTSYLSIPGRYLVMMPQMDRVGVSRKVEDEELRKKMVAILDQLDLPDGFGFILRTAGLDRTKTELKRDLAYLMRLQKDMEKRRKAGSKTRLLYAESDLLLRALRDMLTADTDEVIIDSEPGLKRAANFMRIFSPRSSTKLLHFSGNTPIYHALGVEEQIRTMYSRDVPLPSGGRLVIDEAEALVAIDVNSGKSRSAGDSEENAYNTNLEAADEICRQLRLRDLGGIVINDLIDMRSAKHRRDIEARFQAILETDRARSTVLPIGEFGVLELTRQRMRGSHESIHFQDCPTCRGRGMIQRPDSVAADALRELAALLDHPKVAKAEMVINPRIAGELLSSKRKHLSRLERITGKQLAIRLSDATGLDRVAFYAYDAQGSDIEIDRLPKRHATAEQLQQWVDPEQPEDQDEEVLEEFVFEVDEPGEEEQDPAQPEVFAMELDPNAPAAEGENFSLSGINSGGRKKKRRRGRGSPGSPEARRDEGLRPDGTRIHTPPRGEPVHSPGQQPAHPHQSPDRSAEPGNEQGSATPGQGPDQPGSPTGDSGEAGRRRRRRRRGGRGRGRDAGPDGQPPASTGQGTPATLIGPDDEVERLPPPPTAEDLAEGGTMTLGRLARLLRVRANAIIGTCLDENIPAQLVADENSVIEPELETKIRAWFPPPTHNRPPSHQPSRQPSPGNAELLTSATDGIVVQGPGDDAPQPANPAEGLGSDSNPGTGPNTGTGTEAEKRRRRRRRGGRGRGRGGDAPNPPTAGPAGPAQINADRAPRPPNNQGGRDGGNRNDRGRDRNDRPPSRDTNRAPRPSNSTPAPASPAPAPAPAKPPVRTLYGSVIRKLKPGQIGSIKREE